MFDMQLNSTDMMMDLDSNEENTNTHGNNNTQSQSQSRMVGAGASSMDLEEAAGGGMGGAYTANYIPDIMGNIQLERRLRHWLQSKEDATYTTAAACLPTVKIALSLFRVQQNIYLLDFQRVEVCIYICIYVCICVCLYVCVYMYNLIILLYYVFIY